ncbi:hypothetical protein SmJEL517_g01349 [Synchytrium microbalum]|uniref:RNA helicase n=1 Tax=Synchytrium microbalum TaxID=1806994 RepID=A0A507C533_9FUNG|nr:uncharacterized protein SmJEL517_g01349 [Synchytrium microbalum]TPX36660.1 hypothetical protein SmJEL517_g01349 [Synchytrium microbalum]
MSSREQLPIWRFKDDLIQAFSTYQLMVIVGDTGSGKTTQVPPLILENIPEVKTIAVTQPRRIAAISAARRVADEMRIPLGTKVGYAIRFERKAAANTAITYMTDGLLLREAASDPLMSKYDCVICDEAHERSLETDVLFGLLKTAVVKRPTLRVYVMSATLDVEKFSDFFGKCPIFSIPGRMFDVDIFYLKKMKLAALKSTYIQRSVDTVLHVHKNEEPGDVLVFLTGQNEIDQAMRRLEDELDELHSADIKYGNLLRKVVAYPIYSALETIEQRAIFDPPPRDTRKVIFSTNIAQTSITIPGIRYVVDSGFVKQKMYDPSTGMDALLVVPVSQASATQRAGRAGRTDVGKVYRLYSRDTFDEMDVDTMPEIQRSSLIGTVLTLKQLGIDDILGFEFIDPPDPNLVLAALRQLYLLEALDEDGRITELGHMLHAIPVSPHLGRFLIAAARDHGCSKEALVIASMLSVEEVFVNPRGQKKQAKADEARRDFHHSSGDHLTLYQLYEAYRNAEGDVREWCRDHFVHHRAMRAAENVYEQLVDSMEKLGLPIVSCQDKERKRAKSESGNIATFDVSPILKSLCKAYYPNAAKKHATRNCFLNYASSHGITNQDSGMTQLVALFVSPTSALAASVESGRGRIEWVVYQDIQYSGRANMRIASAMRPEWIQADLPRLRSLDDSRLAAERHLIEKVLETVLPTDAADETGDEGLARGEEPEGRSGEVGDEAKPPHHELLVSKDSFEVVREQIDEAHHAERVATGSGNSNVGEAKQPHAEVVNSKAEEERDKKAAEAKARFLSRKKRQMSRYR